MADDSQSDTHNSASSDHAAHRPARKGNTDHFRFETQAPAIPAFTPTVMNVTIPVAPPPSAALAAAGDVMLTRPIQDLSGDKLLTTVPRQAWNGANVPVLGGIPIVAKLGAGGMGAVYYGWHPEKKVEVAVKVLPFQMAHQEEMVVRFQREARVAAGIHSPHLVSVFDIQQEHSLFFMVMEFVNGCSAGDLLKKAQTGGAAGMPEAEALDITIAATRGVVAAHAANVVHRDIKPDNIFVPREVGTGRPKLHLAKLGDLGLARSQGDATLTVSQVAMGTPGFMAPEQSMDAKRVDKPADIFSLGATLYALLAGRPPFTGETLMVVLMNTVSKPPPPIRSLRPDIPLHAAAVIQRCLEKDPARRFPSADSLLEALVRRRSELPNVPAPAAVQPMNHVGPATIAPPANDAKPVAPPAHSASAAPDTIVTGAQQPAKIPAPAAPSIRPQPARELGGWEKLARGNSRWPNLAAAMLFAYVGLSQILDAEYISMAGWLAIWLHDMGHLFGRFLGDACFVLGGLFFPFVVIGAGLWLCYKFRLYFGGAVALGWLGTWLHFSAQYAGDSREMQLDLHRFEPFEPLTHDWGWLLANLRLLNLESALSGFLHVAAHAAMAGAVLGCLYLFIASFSAKKT